MSDLLSGMRVVDLGRSATGQYCARMLADAGADVIHVEPPGGDPLRRQGHFASGDATGAAGSMFAFLNADKRSVALDPATAEGAALLWKLIEWADVLVEDGMPGELARHGFGPEAVLARTPSLAYVSITPYGQTGPQRDWRATELTIQASAGLSVCNGAEEREPLRYPGNLAGAWAGANAAWGAVAANRYARRTGQGQHVDVSIQESLASAFFLVWADYQYQGALQPRGQRDVLPAADGWIYPRWQPSVPWDIYALAFDAPELSVEEGLQPPLGMGPNAPRVAEVLSEHTRQRRRREWIETCIAHEIPIGFLQSPDELLACPQLEARRFFDRIQGHDGREVAFPGRPYTVNGRRTPALRHVPTPGEHNAEVLAELAAFGTARETRPAPEAAPGGGALAGLRILDNGIVQAGTFPARLLADLGAEILRVENYLRPDGTRNTLPPDGVSGQHYWNQGGVFHEQHRNKTWSLGLDVTQPAGREAFLRAAAACDVVLDSHPPGVLERLGLGYDDLRAVNPDIVLVTTSGYGEGGPYSSIRSYGMMTELAAITWFNGYEGEPPRRGSAPLTDHPSTFHIAFVILAALERRDRTGEGCAVDVSQYEIGVNLMGDLHLARALGAQWEERTGNREPGALLSGCFPCLGEDRWVTLSVADQEQLAALRRLVGAAGEDGLEAAIARWSGACSAQDAAAALQEAGIAAGPVNDARDLLLDTHLQERDFFWVVEHSAEQEGVGKRAFPGAPFKMSITPPSLRCPAPALGQHNEHLATTLLGYSRDEYEALAASGAFGTTPLSAGTIPPPSDPAQRIHLSAWNYLARAKEVDPLFKERLRERFGEDFAVGR